MNACACGCGELCRKTWAPHHNLRAVHRPNQRYARSMPIQRVLPLVEFLFDIYGTGAAEVIGVDERAVRAWRHGGVKRVSPGACRRVVDAVRAEEAKLRREAVQPDSLKRRHERHAARGEEDYACDYCLGVTV